MRRMQANPEHRVLARSCCGSWRDYTRPVESYNRAMRTARNLVASGHAEAVVLERRAEGWRVKRSVSA